jgi:hypothetical protein
MWLGDPEIYGLCFSISPQLFSFQIDLPVRSFRYLSSLPRKTSCFALVNFLRQLGRFTSSLLQTDLLTSQLAASSTQVSWRARSNPLALSGWCLATALCGMRDAELSFIAAWLLCRRKLLSPDIPTMGLGFVGGINIDPELVLLFYCGHCLAYL